MRIRNLMNHSVFFPYAGSGRRGVNLKAGELSAELPASRLSLPAVQSDLRRGRIEALVTPTDKQALAGVIDEELLAQVTVGKAQKDVVEEAPKGKQMDAVVPQDDDKPEDEPDKVYEAGAEEPKDADPVEDEKAAEDAMVKEEEHDGVDGTTEDGAEATGDAQSDDQGGDDEADAETGDEDTTAEDGDADGADAGADAEPAADDSDTTDDAGADAEEEEKPKMNYSKTKKPDLLSEALRRELNVTPDMTKKQIIALLKEDDAKE